MPPNQDNYSRSAAYYSLGVLTVVYSANFIDRQLLAILQESIKEDLNLKDTHLGLLTGFAFAAFYVTAGIPIARMADRMNRRNIVAAALFIWSFMTAISGLAQNYWQLLLARIGVGVGEAGGSPPSHSMISDMFPPEQRASALGIYSTGVNIGILFGFLLGGWLNEFFGWRVAFAVVGAPGILLAVIVYFTVKEPTRGQSETRTESAEASTFGSVLSLLWSRHSFRFLALAGAVNALGGYAMVNWNASFFIRTHGMNTGELGTWLAILLGGFGAIGVAGAGFLADRLGRRDQRWYMWIPAIAIMVSVPFAFAAYSVENKYHSLLLMVLPSLTLNTYLGSSIAMTHGMVGLKMRATASAVLFFIFNIIGLGLGPSSVGIVSDMLAASHGAESLAMALKIVACPAIIVASCLFFLAARHLREDLQRAPA